MVASIGFENPNQKLTNLKQTVSHVNCYDDVFKITDHSALSIVKVRIIQSMIQIVRPVGWNIENIKSVRSLSGVYLESSRLKCQLLKWSVRTWLFTTYLNSVSIVLWYSLFRYFRYSGFGNFDFHSNYGMRFTKLNYRSFLFLVSFLRDLCLTKQYSGDPKFDPLKTGNIWKPDILKVGIWMIGIWNGQSNRTI